jgi:hypothetical protein
MSPLCANGALFSARAGVRAGKEVDEKGRDPIADFERRSAGAKAHANFVPFAARLKPCPCYKTFVHPHRRSLPATAKASLHLRDLCGTTEVVPFQNEYPREFFPQHAG